MTLERFRELPKDLPGTARIVVEVDYQECTEIGLDLYSNAEELTIKVKDFESEEYSCGC